MHQDIFRTAVHRSLSKSLNPREGKSSASSNLPEALAHETSREKGGKGKEKHKEERVKAMTRSNFTELQINKPHGGEIHKSCGTHLEVLSKDLAQTLLKGAIDLQVSIDMLESFQTNVNRKKKVPGKEDAAEGWCAQDLNKNNYISNGGSSKNNMERLKKVIGESLHKQDLITASFDDEKSSLNQLNRVNSNCANSPGIVAKLMGLRETPKDKERFQSTNRDAKVKSLSSLRVVFDLEKMPRVRIEKLPQERTNPNRRALLDIMETMQFKGLMRNRQGDKEAAAFSIREDQNAKLIRACSMKMEKLEMRSFEEDKIEMSKIVETNNVKWKNVDRRAAGSVKQNEKKVGNSITSKSKQMSERKAARASSGASTSQVTKLMPHNSSLPARVKKRAVPMTTGSSNMV
jgi:hypothetical protein